MEILSMQRDQRLGDDPRPVVVVETDLGTFPISQQYYDLSGGSRGFVLSEIAAQMAFDSTLT